MYLGGHAAEEEAARAYDIAAQCVFGDASTLNYPRSGYAEFAAIFAELGKEGIVAHLRRGSRGFAAPGAAAAADAAGGLAPGEPAPGGLLGVRAAADGKWEVRVVPLGGAAPVSLGAAYPTAVAAARVHDAAALRLQGRSAFTNHPAAEYFEGAGAGAASNSNAAAGGLTGALRPLLDVLTSAGVPDASAVAAAFEEAEGARTAAAAASNAALDAALGL